MIKTDSDASKKIGKAITHINILNLPSAPSDEEELEYERFLWFVHSLINHQINSDFLEKKLRSIPVERFDAVSLQTMSSEVMHGLLRDYQKPERIRSEERAKLVSEACRVLCSEYKGKIKNLLEAAEYSVVKLLGLLDAVPALSEDPLRKKANIYVQILSRNGLVEFADINKVEPAIDYQLIRLALRNGRVKVSGPLHDRIVAQEEVSVDDDTAMREKVIEAFKIVASAGGKTIPQLNLIDWHIARSYCVHDEPLCSCEKDPLDGILAFRFSGKCPLFSACEKRKEYKREPLFKTSFY